MSPIGLNSLEIRMKVSCSNCYNFKNPSVLVQTIRSSHNSAYFKNVFLDNFDSCLDYKSFSYTMVYTPGFKEVYLDIRNQSGCHCVKSFLKAGLYCIMNQKLGPYFIYLHSRKDAVTSRKVVCESLHQIYKTLDSINRDYVVCWDILTEIAIVKLTPLLIGGLL